MGMNPGRRACLCSEEPREEPREESVLCGEEPRQESVLCGEEPREETSHCSRSAWWEIVSCETLSLICRAESAEAFHLLDAAWRQVQSQEAQVQTLFCPLCSWE